MIKFNNILVPTDFSKGSENALNSAKEFAKSFKSKIHVLNVIQNTVYSGGIEFGSFNYSELLKDMEENSSKLMKNISDELESEKIDNLMKIRFGIAANEIINYEIENDIDLIISASHGSGGFEHLLFGSTTEKVLRKAVCPILVVRFPK